MEVLCFLWVAKFAAGENRSFVLNRNWRFSRGYTARSAGVTALARPFVMFDIFTDSSSSWGARNAKGCVCTLAGAWADPQKAGGLKAAATNPRLCFCFGPLQHVGL